MHYRWRMKDYPAARLRLAPGGRILETAWTQGLLFGIARSRLAFHRPFPRTLMCGASLRREVALIGLASLRPVVLTVS